MATTSKELQTALSNWKAAPPSRERTWALRDLPRRIKAAKRAEAADTEMKAWLRTQGIAL